MFPAMIKETFFSLWMKKMTKRSKAGRLEKMVASLLTEAGWKIHLVRPWSQDIFGANIIAMKSSHLILFIRVSSDSTIARKIKTFQRHPFPWEFCRVLIFQARKKRSRWTFRVGRVFQSEFEWVTRYFLESLLGEIFFENSYLFIWRSGEEESQ